MQLRFTQDIVPVTDFRNNAADILAQLAKTGRPIVLTQRGRASAVLLEVQHYEQLLDRVEELERQLTGRAPAPAAALTPDKPARSEDDLVRELEKWIEEEG